MDESRSRIAALEEQCDFYSKVGIIHLETKLFQSEKQLTQEIDQLGKAYSELTEAQVDRVIDLGRKEDQISHLSSEVGLFCCSLLRK